MGTEFIVQAPQDAVAGGLTLKDRVAWTVDGFGCTSAVDPAQSGPTQTRFVVSPRDPNYADLRYPNYTLGTALAEVATAYTSEPPVIRAI